MATKTKFRTQYNEFEHVKYFCNAPSMTRPNQSLSLKQLFAMYRRGQIVEPLSRGLVDNEEFAEYLANLEDHDLTQLDAIRQRSNTLYIQRKQLEELHAKELEKQTLESLKDKESLL